LYEIALSWSSIDVSERSPDPQPFGHLHEVSPRAEFLAYTGDRESKHIPYDRSPPTGLLGDARYVMISMNPRPRCSRRSRCQAI
jgi:hypothetical protein